MHLPSWATHELAQLHDDEYMIGSVADLDLEVSDVFSHR
jgi:hypothetical protein